MKTKIALLAATLFATAFLATDAVARPLYVGEWASNRAQCSANALVGRVSATERRLQQGSTLCRFNSVTRVNGAWKATGRCMGGGSSGVETQFIWATATRLTIRVPKIGTVDHYVRCP